MREKSMSEKVQTSKRRIPAGARSDLLSKGKKKMPTTGGYAVGKATIFSPSSRGI